jgi:hypothetical protein
LDPRPAPAAPVPDLATKRDLEEVQAKLRENYIEIAAKESQIDSLKALTIKQEQDFKEFRDSLEVQSKRQLDAQTDLHRREVDFIKEAQDKLVGHYKGQLTHLQRLLEEKATENADFRQRLGMLEGQMRLNVDPQGRSAANAEAVSSLTETQVALEAKIQELSEVICSLEGRERDREFRTNRSEDVLHKKRLDLARRETEVAARETQLNLHMDSARKKVEADRESLRVEALRITQAETEFHAKLASVVEREGQLMEARETFLAQQQSSMATLSRSQEECEHLKIDLLRKEQELTVRLRAAQEFLSTHDVRSAQMQLKEETQAIEAINFQNQRRTLEEKENHLRSLERTITGERSKMEELSHQVQVKLAQDRLVQTTSDWRQLSSNGTSNIGRLRSVIREPFVSTDGWVNTLRLTSHDPTSLSRPSADSKTLLQTLKSTQRPTLTSKFDLEGYIKRITGPL